MRASPRRVALVSLGILTILGVEMARADSSGLVRYYPFKGNANDESGFVVTNGTVHGAVPTTDRYGNPDSAYQFNGTSDYIVAPAVGLPTAERTISLWLRMDDAVEFQAPVVFSYGGGACGTSWFQYVSPVMLGRSSHCSVQTDEHSDTLQAGVWYHWVMTTSASGTTMYLDCQPIATFEDYIENTDVSGADLAIGTCVGPEGRAPYSDGSVKYFHGAIDDVRIFDRELTSTEIEGLCTGAPNPPGLVRYYPLDGDANDEVGLTYTNATASGATLTADRFGNPDSAYHVDGVDQYVVADAVGLPTAERTVAFWFMADQLLDYPTVVPLSYGGGDCGTTWFEFLSSSVVGRSSHCSIKDMQYEDTLKPGLWYHWVTTTSATGTRMYLNTSLIYAFPEFVDDTGVSGTLLLMGACVDYPGRAPYEDGNVTYFEGAIDEVRIYDRALSASEIRAIWDPPTAAGDVVSARPDLRVYPNPFNPNARIEIDTARSGPVRVTIHDAKGRLIRSLANGAMPAGSHELVWRGVDDVGRAVASGVYFCRAVADGVTVTRQLTLTK